MSTQRRLALGDEFWLIAHHDYSGKPLRAGPVVGAGLAGAVLAELVMARQAVIAQGRVLVPQQTPRPADSVALMVAGEIARQPVAYPVRDWISHLVELVYEPVCQRLIAGNLVEEVRGGPFGKRKYVPKDPAIGASPAVLLYYMIDIVTDRPEDIDYQTATLAGLTLATRLDTEIVSADHATVRKGLRTMVELLPADILALLGAVQSVVNGVPLRVNR
jgi:hypothetical protein